MLAALLFAGYLPFAAALETNSCLSPTALAATRDGKMLYIACFTANRVLGLDLQTRKLMASVTVPAPPTGLALSMDGSKLFVTCAAFRSTVCIVDLARHEIDGQIQAGHTAMAPVASPDGKLLFVCNRFNNDVSVLDLHAAKELRRIPVRREPVAAAITPDGKYLLVANALPTGRATARWVSAVVCVINLADGLVVRDLRPPNGSTSLNDLCVSPDGKYAAVTHVVSHFRRPADRVAGGWLNFNALTLIDLGGLQTLNTVVLDDPAAGAANPWGLAWSADGATLAVAHAGTHEVSLIDFAGLLAKLRAAPSKLEVPEDPDFLGDLRRRILLPELDRGPRALAIAGATAYAANYFSDTLSLVPLATTNGVADSLPLGPTNKLDLIRQGELYFHDATLCFQGWLSCSTCHPGDGRMDGLNWDLLNDGAGNPKNSKSLLLAHQTPPAMSLGVRDTAEVAVRAGLEHILFTRQPEAVPAAIDAYLKSLRPVPSPLLEQDSTPELALSRSAQRGKRLFIRAGCSNCHPPGLFTDLHQYDVGTRARFDQPDDEFDTPTLVELWRTAPYLHDGSAATVREVLTGHNPREQHGHTAKLTDSELDDLCAYLLSL